MPPRYGQTPAELTAMPVEQYRQQEQIYQAATSPDALAANQAPPQQGNTAPALPASGDRSTMLYILVVAALAGVGWWAYKAMEKDRKFKLGSGPRKMESYGAEDDDAGGSEDDGDPESDSALDAYADADVDKEVRSPPHEAGGIKLVKG